MSPQQEEVILKIGKDVANKSRLEDKEEAYSVALLGVARGLSTYVPAKGTKLTTYLYKCAQMECWAEWRRIHRIKRGTGKKDISLEEFIEKGGQI